jgi:Family of unknown function (DUF6232)
MEEQAFFTGGGVRVTNARFVVDANTYSVRNITSTAVWSQSQKWLGGVVCILIALGCIREATGAAVVFGIFAAGFFYFGRPVHFVRLHTSGGEVKAVRSHDLNFVKQIVDALNDAIVSQHKPT